MLIARRAPEGRILHVAREGDALCMQTDMGEFRVEPKRADIFRVRFAREALSLRLGVGILRDEPFAEWRFEERPDAIVLSTAKAALHIDRETSAIRYRDADGKLLLAETKRALEPFTAYPPTAQGGESWEDIETPDGVKRVLARRSDAPAQTLCHTWLHFSFQQGEALYGLGQAEEGALNLRGTTQYLHQANRKIAVPMLLSSRGWGILSATGGPAIFQDTQYGSYLYTEADEEMDYYFLAGGGLDGVVSGYRFLTGKAVMPPRWALGYIQSQERYETQEELLRVAREYRARHIGLDCVVQDWYSWREGEWGQKSFDPERFGDMTATLRALHGMNVRFMLSIWPNMDANCPDHREFADKGLLLPESDLYDAFSPEARALYWQQADRSLFCHGIDAWWCDSSEPFTPEWTHPVKPDPSVMYREYVETAARHAPIQLGNAYALFHARTIFEGQRASGSEKRVVNLTRSAHTGQQRYGAILWSGDIAASWKTLRSQIAAGLNFCASGLPYWTLDIGAFFVKKGEMWYWQGEYEKGFADPRYCELFVRWYQLGAFLPVFRGHGTDIRRELWHACEGGAEYYEALLAANRLRYRLLPYLYSIAGAAWREDATLLRLLAFDFPQDARALEIADEFLLGPAILVCPVTEPAAGGVCSREVYLPSGADWIDFHTGERFSGGQSVTVEAPLCRIPLFVRAGSVLPIGPALESTADFRREDVELWVYPGADGSFDLYEDAGDGYGYERGEYAVTTVRWIDSERRCAFEHHPGAGWTGSAWTPPVRVIG